MFGFGDLVGGLEKYVENPLLAVGFTVGGVGIGVVCAGATAAIAPVAGPAACALAGATITGIGIAYGYATYREFAH